MMFSFSAQYSDAENGYKLVSALFLRALAVIYCIAFFTLTFQISGLAGEQGILPLAQWIEKALQTMGWQAFVFHPMLFWFGSNDWLLQAATWLGCGLSLLLFLNIWPRAVLIALFVLYLSLVTAGGTFMNFQWDGLLLEAGFLAIFLRPDSRVLIFLMRWLLFRLRFMSGISKIVMGDPAWTGFTALLFYFETQPLPHVGSWYFHNLPQWLLIAATVLVLIIEIVVPFMMFMSRRYRFFAAWVTIIMQLLIIASSNHNWFNLLTLALCLFLFDDKALRRVVPAAAERWLTMTWHDRLQHRQQPWSVLASYLLASVIVGTGLFSIHRMVTRQSLGVWPDQLVDVLQQWHIVNAFHVFPTMTTQLIELKIEGSNDGIHWKRYRFKYRPDALDQRPQIVLPHHPRLDWMMWFVPFHPRFLDWFDDFLLSLLQGRPPVLALLADNPFPDAPPNRLRVRAYHYRFTTPQQRELSGHWWQRQDLGIFKPMPGMYLPPEYLPAATQPGQ